MKKVVYMSSDPIGLPLLEYLQGASKSGLFDLKAVFSNPDRPVGRGKHVQPNAVSQFALDHGVLLFRPEKLTAQETEWLKSEQIDVAIVIAYGHLIKKELLEAPKFGMINLHGSILPKYRGASPVETAIACGETQTGVSLMRMDVGMDTGPVAAIKTVSIDKHDTGESLRSKIAEASKQIVEANIAELLAGNLIFKEQSHENATYTRKFNKEDAWISFDVPAAEIFNRARAMLPRPGCFVKLGDEVFNVRLRDYVIRSHSHACGEIAALPDHQSDCIQVAAKEGFILIESLQRAAGKMLSAKDFINGCHLKIAMCFENNLKKIPLVGAKSSFVKDFLAGC